MAKPPDNQFLKRVALRIKQLRQEKGITEEDFLNDTGIHIARIETAQRDFSMTTLQAICKYFGISVSEFFKDFK
ncbi:MAG: helix-turn-helix transcriptional regulator [Bacteroidota bacterium]|nr:helix-turn-helix transcriptional regulator [Bacteroidota bacterium]